MASADSAPLHIYERPLPSGIECSVKDWRRVCFLAWQIGQNEDDAIIDHQDSVVFHSILARWIKRCVKSLKDGFMAIEHFERNAPQLMKIFAAVSSSYDAMKTVVGVYKNAHFKATLERAQKEAIDAAAALERAQGWSPSSPHGENHMLVMSIEKFIYYSLII